MIKIMGHRGARDLWPENSLQGFREAIALGVDLVEFDVHMARDRELMVIHDPTLDRTTEGSGPVNRLDGRAIGAIRLKGTADERVPTLDAVLGLFAQTRIGVFVEIKPDPTGTPYTGAEAKVLAALERHGMLDRAGILSFVPEILETARRHVPTVTVQAPIFRQTAQMYGGLDRMIDRLDRLEGCLISIERSMIALTREHCMERIPASRFYVDTTNDPAEIAFWMTQDARHICTDRPDLALAARRAAESKTSPGG